MARTAAKLDRRRRRKSRFLGMEGFKKFLQRQCTITQSRTDVIRCRDLYRAYCRFCAAARHPVASVVNVGRYLGGLQVRASRRLGGCNGRRQEYAYVGLRLRESSPEAPQKGSPSSPPLSPVTPAPPSPPPSIYESTDFPSPAVSRPPSNGGLQLLDTFLRENVESTGSAEDAVPVGELHAAYRRLCRARGVTPPPSASLSSHLTRREGVVISSLSFETVMRAYQGLKWTEAALTSFTPSRRAQPTPCSSCKAGRLAPTVSGSMADDLKDEVSMEVGTSGDWSSWTNGDGLGEQFSLSLFDDDGSGGHFHNLQTASPPPQPTAISQPLVPDLMVFQDTEDLAHLIEAYNSTDLMFS